MSGEAITITWLLNKAWILLVGFFWYGKKNLDSENKKRDGEIQCIKEKQVKMGATFITEEQMKRSIKESLQPVKEDQQEIKQLLRSVADQVNNLSRDMAVQNAIRNIHKNDKQNTSGGD